jgi:hypothetical protein
MLGILLYGGVFAGIAICSKFCITKEEIKDEKLEQVLRYRRCNQIHDNTEKCSSNDDDDKLIIEDFFNELECDNLD